MIYEYKGFKPVIHETAFVHPQAAVTGNVIIGADVYIGPGAALRGDWGEIIIADGCNVQENCTLHMFPGKGVYLEEGAHIGHGAIIHGAKISRNAMIGMNAVIMDDVEIGQNCIIGALAFVKAGTVIPENSLAVGNPAKVIKTLTQEMIDWKTKGTELYQKLPSEMRADWLPCDPLRELPDDRPSQENLYATWESIKRSE